jgi:hypothetical protein
MALKPSHSPPNLACRVSISAGSGLEHAVDLVAPVSTGNARGCSGSITCPRNRTAGSARQCLLLTGIRKTPRHGTGGATVLARPTNLHSIAARRISYVGGVNKQRAHLARRRLTVDPGVVGKASHSVAGDARELTSCANYVSGWIRRRTRVGPHSRRIDFRTVDPPGGIIYCEGVWHVSVRATVLAGRTSLQLAAV